MADPDFTFIVWSPTGPTNPRQTHRFRGEAQRAAKQMAEQHPGQRFFVCEAIDLYAATVITHVDLQAERFEDEQRRLNELADAEVAPRPPLCPDGCKCVRCDIPF